MNSPHARIRDLEEAVRILTAEKEALSERAEALHAENSRLNQAVAERVQALDAVNQELRQQIVDREQVEHALTVSLEKYRVLFESFPLGVTITDAQGQILEANHASVRLLHLPVEEQTRRTVASQEWQITDRDGRPLPAESFASSVALRERRPVHGQEMQVHRGDGSSVWLDVSAAPIPLDGYGVAITYGDASDRKATEAAMRAAEQRYRALFDHAAEGIALHRLVRDADGRIVDYVVTDINRQYEAILGVDRGAVVGRAATEIYGTAEPPYLEEYSGTAVTGEPLRFDTYFPPMDKHFSISVAPLGPDAFATIFFDVTAMRRSQEEHEKLIALVENSHEFIGMATLDTRVFYLNKTARRLSGLTDDDPIAHLSVFDFAPDTMRPLIEERVLPEVRRCGFWSGEAVIENQATGTPVDVEIDVFVIPSRGTGEPLCLATVMRDIGDRVRAREQQHRLEAQLRQSQKMESVGRLAGGVAHDFNNLLTSILGNVELILESVNPADPIHAPLTDVQRAGQSAASLTRQLLAFSRKQIIAPKLLNLNALLADMERMLKRIIGEDVALETRAYPALPCVCADAGQLEQIVVNLAVNARDAMPAGGHLVLETAEVAVDDECCARHVGTRPGPYVRLAVRDTGSGMDADTKAHLFEPFFTTKPQGTGLGLATVYGAVSQNGGFIEVDSETGQGTVVRIYLPAVSGAAEATVAGPVAAARGLETILLVEDEPLVRELARRALVARGYGVIAHASGRDAIEAAARFAGTIELLVTDVVLPGINGRELATQLALTRPGLRTLFTSGYTDDIIGHHGVLEPGVSFLPKPYTPQALAEKVRSVLDAERES